MKSYKHHYDGIPPMPPAPMCVPPVVTSMWMKADYERFYEGEKVVAAARDAWEKEWRAKYAVAVAKEMRDRHLDAGQHDMAAWHERYIRDNE